MRKEVAEEYAKKEKMLFFEVSAIKSTNIKSMLYNSIIELPNFEQFLQQNKHINKKDIVTELGNLKLVI